MTFCKPKHSEKLFSAHSAESNFSFSETKFRDKYSRWMSADPAVGDYIPADAESAKKLPAGGVFALNNLNLYHYGANNPIVYKDPDGNVDWKAVGKGFKDFSSGLGKMALGTIIVAASGASEFFSVGSATPLAVTGGVVGGGLTVNGYVEANVGIVEMIAGLAGEKNGDTNLENLPNSMNDVLAVPADTIKTLATGEASTTFKDSANKIDEALTGVIDAVSPLLITSPKDAIESIATEIIQTEIDKKAQVQSGGNE